MAARRKDNIFCRHEVYVLYDILGLRDARYIFKSEPSRRVHRSLSHPVDLKSPDINVLENRVLSFDLACRSSKSCQNLKKQLRLHLSAKEDVTKLCWHCQQDFTIENVVITCGSEICMQWVHKKCAQQLIDFKFSCTCKNNFWDLQTVKIQGKFLRQPQFHASVNR